MDSVEQEAQNYGYDHGSKAKARRPESDNGTKFTGHLLRGYDRGYALGKQDHELHMQQLRECHHSNAVLSDDNEPATYHCPDCGENFIGTPTNGTT